MLRHENLAIILVFIKVPDSKWFELVNFYCYWEKFLIKRFLHKHVLTQYSWKLESLTFGHWDWGWRYKGARVEVPLAGVGGASLGGPLSAGLPRVSGPPTREPHPSDASPELKSSLQQGVYRTFLVWPLRTRLVQASTSEILSTRGWAMLIVRKIQKVNCVNAESELRHCWK